MPAFELMNSQLYWMCDSPSPIAFNANENQHIYIYMDIIPKWAGIWISGAGVIDQTTDLVHILIYSNSFIAIPQLNRKNAPTTTHVLIQTQLWNTGRTKNGDRLPHDDIDHSPLTLLLEKHGSYNTTSTTGSKSLRPWIHTCQPWHMVWLRMPCLLLRAWITQRMRMHKPIDTKHPPSRPSDYHWCGMAHGGKSSI